MFSSGHFLGCLRLRIGGFLAMQVLMSLKLWDVCHFLFSGFCPITTIKSAVILAPFFVSITVFSNSSRHSDLAPNSEFLSLAVNMSHVFSNPINPLSVKALRCS